MEKYIEYIQKRYNARMTLEGKTPKAERYQLDDIDEMIFPTIKLLNEKGYFTRGSCSGHFEESNKTYIQFDKEIKPEDFPSIPKGFHGEILQLNDCRPLTKQEIESGQMAAFDKVSIYQISQEATGTDCGKFIYILNANAALLKWALELPARKPN